LIGIPQRLQNLARQWSLSGRKLGTTSRHLFGQNVIRRREAAVNEEKQEEEGAVFQKFR